MRLTTGLAERDGRYVYTIELIVDLPEPTDAAQDEFERNTLPARLNGWPDTLGFRVVGARRYEADGDEDG
jgi:hypothetical protein